MIGTAIIGGIVYSTLSPSPAPFNPPNMATAAQSMTACVTPPLAHHSVAPNTILTYQYYGRWPDETYACSARAFETWNAYLTDTELGIMFLPVSDRPSSSSVVDINVIYTSLGGITAGAITGVSRNAAGYLSNIGILITNDTQIISSCLAYYKVTMHEIGHVLGLSHPRGLNQNKSSIMNYMDGENDVNRALPMAPTACDLAQIVVASRQPLF
jgi:hypothetical protein